MTEDRGQMTEDRRQNSEVGMRKWERRVALCAEAEGRIIEVGYKRS